MTTISAQPPPISRSDIPEHILRPLGVATYQFFERFIRQPGARDLLDAETANRKAKLLGKGAQENGR